MQEMNRDDVGCADSTQSDATIRGPEEIVVVGRDLSFVPATVTVETGTALNIVLVNEGDVAQNLTIPDLEVQVVAGPEGRASMGIRRESPGENS